MPLSAHQIMSSLKGGMEMKNLLLGLLAFVFLSLGLSDEVALKREKIAKFGYWEVARFIDEVSGEPKTCAAELVSEKAAFQAILDPAQNTFFIHVWSANWDFRKRERNVALEFGGSTFSLLDATYQKNAIIHGQELSVGATSFMFFSQTEEPLSVLDHNGRKLVDFPTSGLGKAFERAVECAEKIN